MSLKFLVLLAGLTGSLSAQSLSMSATPLSVRAGQSVTVRVSYNTSAPDVAGLQWTLAIPGSLTASQVMGVAGSAASKQLACGPTGICILYGINQTLIGSGDIAVYTITFPSTAVSGNYTFALSGIQGVTSSANPFPVAAPATPTIVTVLSNFDLDGDGLITSSDVGIAKDQAVGNAACGIADVNADSKCNIVDVQVEVNKSLGK